MPLGAKHTKERAEARRLVAEEFRGTRFRCDALMRWVTSKGLDPWHTHKAFLELKAEGKIVRVSGHRRSTVYQWKDEGEPMSDVAKLPKWAQDKIQVLEMRVREMEARARAYEEKKKTRVCIKYLRLSSDEKPLYLPDDRPIRFMVGDADWQYVDVRLKKTLEQEDVFVELMAGGDLHVAPEVRNLLKIFVR